jgi:hypothetical protein
MGLNVQAIKKNPKKQKTNLALFIKSNLSVDSFGKGCEKSFINQDTNV